MGLCVYIGPSFRCFGPSSPSLRGSGARRALRPGFSPRSPRDLSRSAQPSSRASAWKPISPLLAVGRRTLPSYGKVFNTNLMVCLATVHPKLSLLLLNPLAQSMETSLLITFSKTPPNFLASVFTAFLMRACPNSLLILRRVTAPIN